MAKELNLFHLDKIQYPGIFEVADYEFARGISKFIMVDSI